MGKFIETSAPYFLPESLTSLTLKHNLSEETGKTLPTSITKLSLELEPGENFNQLPPHLLQLSVRYKKTSRSFLDFSYLPRDLVSLKIDKIRLADPFTQIASLPPCLETFIMRNYLASCFFEIVPKSLTRLEISQCTLHSEQVPAFSYFLSKLSNLTSLTIEKYPFSNEDIPCLPRYLTELKIPFTQDLTDDALHHLPKNLKNLTLHSHDYLSAEGLKKLPFYLKNNLNHDRVYAEYEEQKFIQEAKRLHAIEWI